MRFAFVSVIVVASFTLAFAQPAIVTPPKVDVTRVQTPVYVVSVPDVQVDTDGALRVTTSPTRQVAMHELVRGSVEPAPECECYVWTDCWCTTLHTSVDAMGYSKVGAFVRTDEAGGAVFELLWRWSADEPFRRVQNGFSGVPFRGYSGEPYVYPGIGGTVALHVEWYTGTVIESARVYLIP